MKQAISVIVVLLFTACSWGPATDSAIGRVDAVDGKPRLIRGERYLELGPGSNIETLDIVILGATDKAVVELQDGTSMSLGYRTQLSIQEYAAGGRPATLRLTSSGGQYRLKMSRSFKRVDASIEINTPFATIRPGGTDLLVDHAWDARSLTIVQLDTGTIWITNQFGEVQLVGAGDASTVSFGRAPSLPVQWAESRWRQAIQSISLSDHP